MAALLEGKQLLNNGKARDGLNSVWIQNQYVATWIGHNCTGGLRSFVELTRHFKKEVFLKDFKVYFKRLVTVINTSFVLLLENLELTLVNKCIRYCVICMTKKAVNTDKYRLVRDYTYGCIYPKRVATIPYCRCPCPICSECIGL